MRLMWQRLLRQNSLTRLFTSYMLEVRGGSLDRGDYDKNNISLTLKHVNTM